MVTQLLIPIGFLVLMGFVQGAFFQYVLKIEVRKFMVSLVLMFSIIIVLLVTLNERFRFEPWLVYVVLVALTVAGANLLALVNKVANIYPSFRR